jgi:hypothetical protein
MLMPLDRMRNCTRQVLATVGASRPLAAIGLSMGREVERVGLEAIAPIATCLGATVEAADASEADAFALRLRGPRSERVLALDLVGKASSLHSPSLLSLARLRATRFLLERVALDYQIFFDLLDNDKASALAGKTLAVTGYCENNIALCFRARALGLRVQVNDHDPVRQLHAMCDGFERLDSRSTRPRFEVSPAAVKEAIDARARSRDPALFIAIRDEFLALVALALLAACEFASETEWIERSDALFFETVLSARAESCGLRASTHIPMVAR